MFPQFKKLHNESGMVLFIVLMVAIIIMILSFGILTQSMNENNYAQQQIDQIVSDQWTKGMYANAYSNSYYLSGGGANVGISTVMNGRSYQVTLKNYGSSSGITTLSSVANYDTL